MKGDRPVTQAYIRKLEKRIADLESKLEDLTERHVELGERLLRLSLSAVPEPRFPFWTWYIRNHVSEQTRVRLGVLITLLGFRLRGEPIPEPFRKDIEGVPRELLNSSEPLTVEDIHIAVSAVTGIQDNDRLAEMFKAMKGQGIHTELCELYLAG